MSTRLEKLTQMQQADPADPFCSYGIALEHAKLGHTDEAMTWLDKTLALDAHYSYAYYQKARLLVQQGKPDDAKAVLDAGMADAAQGSSSDAKHALAEMRSLRETVR